jgi:hypothetical protein
MQLFDHSEALLGALPANVCAAFAVLELFGVAFAFLSARVAYDGTGVTKQRRKLTAHTHQRGVCSADNGALARQRDTPGKHFNVVLFQAFCRAVLTLGGALIATLDTIAENITAKTFIVHTMSF